MSDQAGSPWEVSPDQRIEEVVEILVGDHERVGRLLPEDLARLASKRDLTADEIDEVANRLRERGIDFADEEIPDDFAVEEARTSSMRRRGARQDLRFQTCRCCPPKRRKG